MASAAISWTVTSSGNIVSQEVDYRVTGTTSWTVAVNNLGPTVTSYTVTGLADNTLYEFRVISNCSVGGPITSSLFSGIKYFCPTVTLTPTHNTITYSFSELGGSITGYTVELLNSAQNTVIQTLTTASGIFNSVSIAPSTTYYVRVKLLVDGSHYNQCASTSVATTATPTCPSPTGPSATLS